MAGKPGNPNWTKGVSGNPGGRPRAPVRLRELYDINGTDDEIYERLTYWMRQDDGKVSIAAISKLLEYRYGRMPVVDENGDVVRDQVIRVEIPAEAKEE
jgi:hypothetical protein